VNKEDKKNQDMSIEEILKSIKNAINNRKNFKTNDNDRDEEDILELTEVISEQQPDAKAEEESLISTKSALETSDVLKNFANTMKDKKFEDLNSPKNALEELIIEMLKPELKKWLNENLPSLVKQLVEREIKKLMPNNKK
jgi:cell pole-organizing protein PopZ